MSRIVPVLILLCIGQTVSAQYVYTIKADSVKITNSCDTAELILENHTQTVPGFLFNKGMGRTEFRRAAVKLNDSMYIIGADTLKIHVGAMNGLSANNGNVVLGQDIGQTGNPAALISNREIPMNGFGLNFNNGPISITETTSGSDNTGAVNISSTWNTTGSPTAFKLNVINTVSGASPYIMDIQQDGISKLRIPKQSANMLFSPNGVTIRHWSNATGGISLDDSPVEGNAIIVNPGFRLSSSSTNNVPNINVISFTSAEIVPTSGTCSILDLSNAPFKPISGTAVMNMLNLAAAINQHGLSTGITRGLYINTNIDSAADFRAIEIARGKSILNGKVTVNSSAVPTAGLMLGAGTATAGTAPIKLTAGTVMSTPEDGAIEYDGTNYYITQSTTRYTLTKTLSGQITTNFGGPSLSAFNSVTTTLSVPGAAVGDVVNVSANSGSVNPASIIITAYITTTNTVTLQAYNASNSAVTIASDTYKVRVIK